MSKKKCCFSRKEGKQLKLLCSPMRKLKYTVIKITQLTHSYDALSSALLLSHAY